MPSSLIFAIERIKIEFLFFLMNKICATGCFVLAISAFKVSTSYMFPGAYIVSQ